MTVPAVIGVILAAIYLWGVQNMYFHQDDLDWFLLANRSWSGVMSYPIGDHVNYLFRFLIKMEWDTFGFVFSPYLLVSVLMHACVIWLIYLVAKISTNRSDLAALAALIFSINTNWTEVVLWISGQTISISAIFILWAMLSIWRKKGEGVMLFLASWTSALALGLVGATAMTYKHLRLWTGAVLLIVVGIYLLRGGDGTSVIIGIDWMGQVVLVVGLMLVNTVLGRLMIPFDRLETIRIVVVAAVLIYVGWKYRNKLVIIWRDAWSRFLCWQIIFYYLIVSAGRAQFGVGIMRAERYAYIGLALVLLLLVRMLRNTQLGWWRWAIPVILIIQTLGLYQRASTYIERPQQLKILVEEMRGQREKDIEMEAYLPRFVLQDDRLKYRDLMSLIND